MGAVPLDGQMEVDQEPLEDQLLNDHLEPPQMQQDATLSPAACDFEASGGLNGANRATNHAAQNTGLVPLCDLVEKVISQSNPSVRW
jgi:hypothetical protein